MNNKLNACYLKIPDIEDVDMVEEYAKEYKKLFPKYHGLDKENYGDNLKTWEEYRKATKNNCSAIVHIVTIAWNETYKGIVNEKFLNALYKNEEQRKINMYNNSNELELEFSIYIYDSIESLVKGLSEIYYRKYRNRTTN